VRYLFISDLHLDARTAGVPRFEELSDSLELTCEQAAVLKVDQIVFAGDLCDPGMGAHRCVARAIRFAEQAPVPSIWVTGNHDVVEDGTGASTLDPIGAAGYSVISQPDVTCSGEVLWLPFTARALAYDPSAIVEQTAEFGSGVRLVVGHLNLKGITPGSETTSMPRGREVFWPVDKIKACLPQALAIGGHYHKAQFYKGVEIIGSSARLNFAEEDSEPRLLVADTDSRTTKLESHKLPARRVFSLSASELDQAKPGDIVRVVLANDENVELAESALRAAGIDGTVSSKEYQPAAPVAEDRDSFADVARALAATWQFGDEDLEAELRKLVDVAIDEAAA
jgi:DNA repair exonuclease SbcCD nuclease subunit